jgi:hypothetical protein
LRNIPQFAIYIQEYGGTNEWHESCFDTDNDFNALAGVEEVSDDAGFGQRMNRNI